MIWQKHILVGSLVILLILSLCSWSGDDHAVIGPVPAAPDYTDSTQWYIRDRGVTLISFILFPQRLAII